MGALLGGLYSPSTLSKCIMENAEGARNLNLDFGGYGLVHRRRLRPLREPSHDDLDHRDVTDALLNKTRNEILLPIPFASRSCEICLQKKEGDYIFLNLNAAMQHARSHHCGVGVLYAYYTCGKTYIGKHAAQCHVPKCKGPPTAEGKSVICQICKRAFGSQRGLSTHERLMHPLERNEKREKAASNKQNRGPNIG